MPIVTLTSDYGWKDPDGAIVRGRIYSEMLRSVMPAPLIDITHSISPRDHLEAAYIIRNSYQSFPKGSIHIMLVDSMTSNNIEVIAIELDGHFFLAPNHGGLSLIRPDLMVINATQIQLKNRLELTDLESQIAAAAIHLLNKGKIETLGSPLKKIRSLQTIHPEMRNENTAIVHVQYIDHFGQLVTNASQEWLKKWHNEKYFYAIARGRRISNWISTREEMKNAGSLYLRINRANFLEIGIIDPGDRGSNTAASLLGMVIHDPIELQLK